jgi:hypothetical protein
MELGGDNDEGYESEGGEDIWVNFLSKESSANKIIVLQAATCRVSTALQEFIQR